MVWATELHQTLLKGINFTLETDHEALKYLIKTKEPVGRLARWAMKLQEFDMYVNYRKGEENGAADFVSRLYEKPDGTYEVKYVLQTPQTFNKPETCAQITTRSKARQNERTHVELPQIRHRQRVQVTNTPEEPKALEYDMFKTEQQKDELIQHIIKFKQSFELPNDNKIANLQSAIASFPTNAPPKNNPIRAIKNLKTSTGLNLEPYPDPATQTSLPTTYKGNGATKYPNYLIYSNNGCLQYAAADASTKAPATWTVQPCNSNLGGQRFNMQQVGNMDQYNKLITDPNNASYKITDPNSTIFGFYVVNPEGQSDQCLQLNGDGLSVMPCNMDASQRFKPYYHSIKP